MLAILKQDFLSHYKLQGLIYEMRHFFNIGEEIPVRIADQETAIRYQISELISFSSHTPCVQLKSCNPA